MLSIVYTRISMAPRAKLIDITTWLYNSRYKGVQNKPDAGNNTSSKEDVQAAEKLDQGLGDRQYWDANAKRDTTSDAWKEKGWSFRRKVVLMAPFTRSLSIKRGSFVVGILTASIILEDILSGFASLSFFGILPDSEHNSSLLWPKL